MTIVHEKRLVRTYDWVEIKRLLTAAACREGGMPNATASVTYREETEGSPGYRIGFSVTVELVEDLSGQATQK